MIGGEQNTDMVVLPKKALIAAVLLGC